MKLAPHFLGLIIALGLSFGISWPATAQNAAQVAKAQAAQSCPGCNLFQADLSNLEIKGKNFSKSRLRQADLSLGDFNRTSFAYADVRDLNGSAALFNHSNFTGANLTNANFVGAYLEGARFNKALLSGVNFSGAEMATALGLTQKQLDQACGDEATRLPRGLRIPVCK